MPCSPLAPSQEEGERAKRAEQGNDADGDADSSTNGKTVRGGGGGGGGSGGWEVGGAGCGLAAAAATAWSDHGGAALLPEHAGFGWSVVVLEGLRVAFVGRL